MASQLYDQLRADIITAMKARDSVTTTALRTADAAIKRAELDGNVQIDDALVLTTLRKAVKNLSDAREDFAKAGRADLVAANDAEISLLSKYLPQSLAPEKLETLVIDAIAATGATAKRDMGRVIATLKQHAQAGSIDFGTASKLIQARLS